MKKFSIVKSPRWRLALAVGLFFAWIGWLAYLACATTRPIVLSRPQFLASRLDVIGDIAEKNGRPEGQITVCEVLWPAAEADKLVGKTITVTNLAQAKEDGRVVAASGWQGPGRYILPLVPDGTDYQVAKIPPSPGFDAAHQPLPPPIYRSTPETLHQLAEIRKD